jgi:hypothetical protein
MTEELAGLLEERTEAGAVFVRARANRDREAAYCDSVIGERNTVAQPAWHSFAAAQTAMDMAGDYLMQVCGAVTDCVVRDSQV